MKSEIIKIFENDASRVKYDLIHVPVIGVYDREILYFCKKLQFDEDSYGTIETSVDIDDVKPGEGVLRADVFYCLHIFEPLPGDNTKTHMTGVGFSNPNGMIPASIVNIGLSRRADFYRQYIDILLKSI